MKNKNKMDIPTGGGGTEKKVFKTNFEKLLYIIEIRVYENSQVLKIIPEDGAAVTYQSLIGALEISKTSTVITQSTQNLQDWISFRKKEVTQNKKLKSKP